MSDRQKELLRQHALLREHLAWLEQEIARESVAPAVDQSLSPAGEPQIQAQFQAQAQPKISPPAAPVATVDADALLNDYAAEERHDPNATKRGCLLVFALVLGMLVCGVAAAYFVFYAHR